MEYNKMQNYILIKKLNQNDYSRIILVEAYDYSAIVDDPEVEVWAEINYDYNIQNERSGEFEMFAAGEKLAYSYGDGFLDIYVETYCGYAKKAMIEEHSCYSCSSNQFSPDIEASGCYKCDTSSDTPEKLTPLCESDDDSEDDNSFWIVIMIFIVGLSLLLCLGFCFIAAYFANKKNRVQNIRGAGPLGNN
jgi:hypothetical protein